MKNIILMLSLFAIIACEEKPKPKPIDGFKVVETVGKTYRALKDSFKKGYNDTTKTDSIK